MKTECAANKVTVTGKVDPAGLREKLEQKIKKKVDLISPQPKKDGGGDKKPAAAEEKAEKKPEEKKPAEKKTEEKKPKEAPKEVNLTLMYNLRCILADWYLFSKICLYYNISEYLFKSRIYQLVAHPYYNTQIVHLYFELNLVVFSLLILFFCWVVSEHCGHEDEIALRGVHAEDEE